MYDRDDLDSLKQIASLRMVAEERKKAANDNKTKDQD